MIIDLRKGFGDFEDYNLFKFPDNSIKFILKGRNSALDVTIKTSLRTNDDLIVLGLVKQVLDKYIAPIEEIKLEIYYMMYQQDDRQFDFKGSFGLQFVGNYINSLNFDLVVIYHPHSDVTPGIIKNSFVTDNTDFIKWVLSQFNKPPVWVIPDSGAFKTQFKQIEKLGHKDFITCMKSRDHATGEIKTIVNGADEASGRDYIIFDDICLGGRTFLNIAKELSAFGARNIYLAVSHGVFNTGINHLELVFEEIFTTDSICTLPESQVLKIMKL